MSNRRDRGVSIRTQITLTFVVVAVLAVVLFALIVEIAARGDVANLARQEQQRSAANVADVAGDAYALTHSWTVVNLAPLSELAADYKATLRVFDASGRAIPVPPSHSAPPRVTGRIVRHDIEVSGKKVGILFLHFYNDVPRTAEENLRNALIKNGLYGLLAAVFVAFIFALMAGRRRARPITVIIKAVRSMASGDRAARIGRSSVRGQGELTELAEAFDEMADALEAQEELRRNFSADVAHELRTPLAILQAITESLTDGSVLPERDILVSLHEEILRLSSTVEDLNWPSTTGAYLSIHIERLDISKCVGLSLDPMRVQFASAGIDLEPDLKPAVASADPARLGQLVVNLLSNSLKFTRRGGKVLISTATDKFGPYLEVSDNGIGISPDELPYVFERFWRGKDAAWAPGSGVGLAVVRALAEAQGGSVEITSELGVGTKVIVRLAS